MEYVYETPFTIAVRTPAVMAYIGDVVQSFEMVPFAAMKVEPSCRFCRSLLYETISTNDDSSIAPVDVADAYSRDAEVASRGEVVLDLVIRCSVHRIVVIVSKLVGALVTVIGASGIA